MSAVLLSMPEPAITPIPIGHLSGHLTLSVDPSTDAATALIEQFLVFCRQAERTIADQAARIEQLELLSLTDELTALPNRRHFDREFNRRLALARRYGEHGVVALIDMDHFKAINDTHGHSVGDLALVSFAQMLGRSVRTTDFVARLGGDEFVILMIHGNAPEAKARMRMIQRTINTSRIEIGSSAFNLSASFGIATYGPNDTVAEVMQRADLAMYADKSERRAAA